MSSTRARRSTRCTCGSATNACSYSCRRTLSGEDIFSRLRLFLVLLRLLGRARPPLRGQAADRLGLAPDSFVVEVASNDGYLLQHFVERGFRSLGIEPAANVAAGRDREGHSDRGRLLRRARPASGSPPTRQGRPDRGATTCFAHVPDIHRLHRTGWPRWSPTTAWSPSKFPHLLRLIDDRQYDTIYHEHFSYLSLLTTERVLAARGPDGHRRRGAADARRIAADLSRTSQRRAGGTGRASRRCLARRGSSRAGHCGGPTPASPARSPECENDLARVPDRRARGGKTVAGYGAPGKGNTLLNYCGVRPDLIAFTVDRNPFKQGSSCPARTSRSTPASGWRGRARLLLILPWNLRDEIAAQLATYANGAAGCGSAAVAGIF